MYKVEAKSFVITNWLLFNSPLSFDELKSSIKNNEKIKIYTRDTFRTGHKDTLLIDLLVTWSYAIGDKETYEVLEDGKEVWEKQVEEAKAEEEARAKDVEAPEVVEEMEYIEQKPLEAKQE